MLINLDNHYVMTMEGEFVLCLVEVVSSVEDLNKQK